MAESDPARGALVERAAALSSADVDGSGPVRPLIVQNEQGEGEEGSDSEWEEVPKATRPGLLRRMKTAAASVSNSVGTGFAVSYYTVAAVATAIAPGHESDDGSSYSGSSGDESRSDDGNAAAVPAGGASVHAHATSGAETTGDSNNDGAPQSAMLKLAATFGSARKPSASNEAGRSSATSTKKRGVAAIIAAAKQGAKDGRAARQLELQLAKQRREEIAQEKMRRETRLKELRAEMERGFGVGARGAKKKSQAVLYSEARRKAQDDGYATDDSDFEVRVQENLRIAAAEQQRSTKRGAATAQLAGLRAMGAIRGGIDVAAATNAVGAVADSLSFGNRDSLARAVAAEDSDESEREALRAEERKLARLEHKFRKFPEEARLKLIEREMSSAPVSVPHAAHGVVAPPLAHGGGVVNPATGTIAYSRRFARALDPGDEAARDPGEEIRRGMSHGTGRFFDEILRNRDHWDRATRMMLSQGLTRVTKESFVNHLDRPALNQGSHSMRVGRYKSRYSVRGLPVNLRLEPAREPDSSAGSSSEESVHTQASSDLDMSAGGWFAAAPAEVAELAAARKDRAFQMGVVHKRRAARSIGARQQARALRRAAKEARRASTLGVGLQPAPECEDPKEDLRTALSELAPFHVNMETVMQRHTVAKGRGLWKYTGELEATRQAAAAEKSLAARLAHEARQRGRCLWKGYDGKGRRALCHNKMARTSDGVQLDLCAYHTTTCLKASMTGDDDCSGDHYPNSLGLCHFHYTALVGEYNVGKHYGSPWGGNKLIVPLAHHYLAPLVRNYNLDKHGRRRPRLSRKEKAKLARRKARELRQRRKERQRARIKEKRELARRRRRMGDLWEVWEAIRSGKSLDDLERERRMRHGGGDKITDVWMVPTEKLDKVKAQIPGLGKGRLNEWLRRFAERRIAAGRIYRPRGQARSDESNSGTSSDAADSKGSGHADSSSGGLTDPDDWSDGKGGDTLEPGSDGSGSSDDFALAIAVGEKEQRKLDKMQAKLDKLETVSESESEGGSDSDVTADLNFAEREALRKKLRSEKFTQAGRFNTVELRDPVHVRLGRGTRAVAGAVVSGVSATSNAIGWLVMRVPGVAQALQHVEKKAVAAAAALRRTQARLAVATRTLEAAAVEYQSRVPYQVRMRSALVIQAYWRGHLARAPARDLRRRFAYHAREAALEIIVRTWRVYVARVKYRREAFGRKILQRLVVRAMKRMHNRHIRARNVIVRFIAHCAFRNRWRLRLMLRGVRAVERRRQREIQLMSDEEEHKRDTDTKMAAADRITRWALGTMGRWLAGLRIRVHYWAANAIGEWYHGAVERHRHRNALLLARACVIRLQCAARSYEARMEANDRRWASTVIGNFGVRVLVVQRLMRAEMQRRRILRWISEPVQKMRGAYLAAHAKPQHRTIIVDGEPVQLAENFGDLAEHRWRRRQRQLDRRDVGGRVRVCVGKPTETHTMTNVTAFVAGGLLAHDAANPFPPVSPRPRPAEWQTTLRTASSRHQHRRAPVAGELISASQIERAKDVAATNRRRRYRDLERSKQPVKRPPPQLRGELADVTSGPKSFFLDFNGACIDPDEFGAEYDAETTRSIQQRAVARRKVAARIGVAMKELRDTLEPSPVRSSPDSSETELSDGGCSSDAETGHEEPPTTPVSIRERGSVAGTSAAHPARRRPRSAQPALKREDQRRSEVVPARRRRGESHRPSSAIARLRSSTSDGVAESATNGCSSASRPSTAASRTSDEASASIADDISEWSGSDVDSERWKEGGEPGAVAADKASDANYMLHTFQRRRSADDATIRAAAAAAIVSSEDQPQAPAQNNAAQGDAAQLIAQVDSSTTGAMVRHQRRLARPQSAPQQRPSLRLPRPSSFGIMHPLTPIAEPLGTSPMLTAATGAAASPRHWQLAVPIVEGPEDDDLAGVDEHENSDGSQTEGVTSRSEPIQPGRKAELADERDVHGDSLSLASRTPRALRRARHRAAHALKAHHGIRKRRKPKPPADSKYPVLAPGHIVHAILLFNAAASRRPRRRSMAAASPQRLRSTPASHVTSESSRSPTVSIVDDPGTSESGPHSAQGGSVAAQSSGRRRLPRPSSAPLTRLLRGSGRARPQSAATKHKQLRRRRPLSASERNRLQRDRSDAHSEASGELEASYVDETSSSEASSAAERSTRAYTTESESLVTRQSGIGSRAAAYSAKRPLSASSFASTVLGVAVDQASVDAIRAARCKVPPDPPSPPKPLRVVSKVTVSQEVRLANEALSAMVPWSKPKPRPKAVHVLDDVDSDHYHPINARRPAWQQLVVGKRRRLLSAMNVQLAAAVPKPQDEAADCPSSKSGQVATVNAEQSQVPRLASRGERISAMLDTLGDFSALEVPSTKAGDAVAEADDVPGLVSGTPDTAEEQAQQSQQERTQRIHKLDDSVASHDGLPPQQPPPAEAPNSGADRVEYVPPNRDAQPTVNRYRAQSASARLIDGDERPKNGHRRLRSATWRETMTPKGRKHGKLRRNGRPTVPTSAPVARGGGARAVQAARGERRPQQSRRPTSAPHPARPQGQRGATGGARRGQRVQSASAAPRARRQARLPPPRVRRGSPGSFAAGPTRDGEPALPSAYAEAVPPPPFSVRRTRLTRPAAAPASGAARRRRGTSPSPYAGKPDTARMRGELKHLASLHTYAAKTSSAEADPEVKRRAGYVVTTHAKKTSLAQLAAEKRELDAVERERRSTSQYFDEVEAHRRRHVVPIAQVPPLQPGSASAYDAEARTSAAEAAYLIGRTMRRHVPRVVDIDKPDELGDPYIFQLGAKPRIAASAAR